MYQLGSLFRGGLTCKGTDVEWGECRSLAAELFLQGRENPAKLNLRKNSEGHSQICGLARRESKENSPLSL